MKTNELTAYAKQRMTEIGAVAMRINTGAVFDEKFGGHRKTSHETGISDTVYCYPLKVQSVQIDPAESYKPIAGQSFIGIYLGIEVKSKASGDRYLRLNQYRHCLSIIQKGGRVLVARTPEDVDQWIADGFPNSTLTDFLKKPKNPKK